GRGGVPPRPGPARPHPLRRPLPPAPPAGRGGAHPSTRMNSYPHRIRLRGPWECEPLARAGPGALPPPGRVSVPCTWAEGGLPDFAGRARFRRRFGYPGRIDPHERVWLTFAGVSDRAEVALNGTALGRHEGPGPFEFEVTALLLPRNELV